MIRKECQTVCRVVPVMARPLKTKSDQQSIGWLIYFKQNSLRNGFRIFNESGPAMPFTRWCQIEQCQKCNEFHSTPIYTKAQRCKRCSKPHDSHEYQIPDPKCSNCAGPYKSTDLKCMARPFRLNGIVTPRTPAEL